MPSVTVLCKNIISWILCGQDAYALITTLHTTGSPSTELHSANHSMLYAYSVIISHITYILGNERNTSPQNSLIYKNLLIKFQHFDIEIWMFYLLCTKNIYLGVLNPNRSPQKCLCSISMHIKHEKSISSKTLLVHTLTQLSLENHPLSDILENAPHGQYKQRASNILAYFNIALYRSTLLNTALVWQFPHYGQCLLPHNSLLTAQSHIRIRGRCRDRTII